MNFSPQEIKKYEEVDALIQYEMQRQGIPRAVFEKVINIIDDFEVENSGLKKENRAAFLSILILKAYNEGRIYGINEEQTRKAGVHK